MNGPGRALRSAAVAANALLLLMVWNNCSKAAFSTEDYGSCSKEGIDLSKCSVDVDLNLIAKSQSAAVKSRKEADILFVVDNSRSMQQEQVDIGLKINGFISRLAGIDWQIALTTTDQAGTTRLNGVSYPWGDGQFRPFDSNTGSQFILRSREVSAAQAQSYLANAISVGTTGGAVERGINATYRAVERSTSAGVHRDFFRSSAALAVILISDEDECSTGLEGCQADSFAASTASKSVPQNLVRLVHETFGSNKTFAFNSIVRIPGDASCTTTNRDALVYREATQLTGGVIGTICSTDFTSQLSVLASKVVDLLNAVTLECVPQDLSGDTAPDVTIKRGDGSRIVAGFRVSGALVEFSSPLPEDTYTFHYFCKQN